METSLYKFILNYSLRQQVILTLLSVASFAPYYYYLSMPKAIVNEGIAGKGIKFPIDFMGLGIVSLDQTEYLMMLTIAFLLLVVVQQGFKYVINVFQGISGERMLRRLRFELYWRVLRFPLPAFRRMSQGEIIPMITAEVEPLGGFIAESFALPIFQGGLLLVTFGFLMVQNPVMALAAVSLYPLQFWLIPKLQKRVNALGKERVRNQRRLADRIGETISATQEIHTHDGVSRMLADFSRRLGVTYWLRYEIFQRKFVIKFINNFLQQLGPFFFYSIGGYLVIRGELDLGQVIAAVTAHKEMGAPWKELLNHYQTRADAMIKYDQVISQFAQPGMRPAEQQTDDPKEPNRLEGELVATNVVLSVEQGQNILDGISFTAPLPAKIALVGSTGREELLQLIGRLQDPTKGRLTIGGTSIETLPDAVSGRAMAYVGNSAFIFNSTIGDNLFFSLRHRPLRPAEFTPDRLQRHLIEVQEAEEAGNATASMDDDWTDYAAAGASGPEDLTRIAIAAMKIAALDQDVYGLGLRGSVNPLLVPQLADDILKARRSLRFRLAGADITDLVERWDPERYNTNATVAENLMFGTPVGEVFDLDRMAENEYVLSVLDKNGLNERFLAIGYDVAKTMVELFSDLPSDHEFFRQFSFIAADELPEFKEIVQRANADNLATLADSDRARLMSLPFKQIPARHRLGHIEAELQSQILVARKAFAETLPAKLKKSIAIFDPEKFTSGASVLDNILFGKIAYGQAQAQEKVGRVVSAVIDELQLRDRITEVGLAYEVGVAGGRLTAPQRQKLAIARAVIKKPDILLLSEATAQLDNAAQAAVMDALLEEFKNRTVIWSVHRPEMAERFEKVMVIENGRLAEQGSFSELNRDGRRLRALIGVNGASAS